MNPRLPQYLAALKRWELASRALLICYALACIIGFGVGLAALFIDEQSELILYLGMAAGITVLATWAILLLSVIAISMWVYRAHANLHAIGLDGLRYAPGWAVASFFVPVVNLIVPFRAMRELCNRSFGEDAQFASQSVPDVSSWWSCYIVGNLIQVFLIAMGLIELVTPIYFTTPAIANALLALFAVLLLGGAAVFLHRIIGAVTVAQNSVTGVGETFA